LILVCLLHPIVLTLLSESRLIGFTGGNALPFEGVFVNYKRSGLATELFRTLQPGETVTASVNAAKSYKLAGIETAEVTAVQGFKYVTGAVAPASLKDAKFCQSSSSGTVTITPDQSTVARSVSVRSQLLWLTLHKANIFPNARQSGHLASRNALSAIVHAARPRQAL
jgi:hypothetical protein